MPRPLAERAAPVVVVGAGIVGTSTALFLAMAGREVVLVDRAAPGSGCSSGNAGMLGAGSCVPSALPGVLRRVPGMLRGPEGALGVRAHDVLRLSPWLLRFVRAGQAQRVERIADALNLLQSQAMPVYKTLLEEAGARHLIEETGKLHISETEAAWQAGAYGRELQRRRGVPMEEIDGGGARELVPLLGPAVTRAVHYPNLAHSLNPRAMVEALASRFAALGGTIRRDSVQSIEPAEPGGRVLTGSGWLDYSHLVIAAGAWSDALARQIGHRVPLEVQRGYNVELPIPGAGASMPVKSEDRHIVVTPMDVSLRVTGVAEFAAPEAPPTPGRHAALVRHAQAVMPQIVGVVRSDWVGARPCTPDSLPVLGRSPRHRDILLAFGHGHLGLGLGPISGRLVSELIVTGTPSINLTACRVDRF